MKLEDSSIDSLIVVELRISEIEVANLGDMEDASFFGSLILVVRTVIISETIDEACKDSSLVCYSLESMESVIRHCELVANNFERRRAQATRHTDSIALRHREVTVRNGKRKELIIEPKNSAVALRQTAHMSEPTDAQLSVGGEYKLVVKKRGDIPN